MSTIDEVRVYCEVYEQGLDLVDYIRPILADQHINAKITLSYTSKCSSVNNNVISKFLEAKKADLIITTISNNKECPLLVIEYSTAVPTDDHIMQRSDVLYWGSKFGIPSLKISPLDKRMGPDKQHGGGNKITREFETYLALLTRSPYYFIKWQMNSNHDFLETNPEKLSCIPHNEYLKTLLDYLVQHYLNANSIEQYRNNVFNDYYEKNKVILDKYDIDVIKKMFPNSTRINWNGNAVRVKINRFGHAMDPDRGIDYFMNMLLGRNALETEIQIERKTIDERGGYKSLFDGIPKEEKMISIVSEIINSGRKMTYQEATEILFECLNMSEIYRSLRWDGNNAIIDDGKLSEYLSSDGIISHKFIFFLSNKLILTDKERDELVTITWNSKITDAYLNNMKCDNYSITKIKQMTIKDVSEDIITYAAVKVMEIGKLKMAAVSYPGAQGDLCILIGNGRKVDREYVDIIAYRESENKISRLLLQENKINLSNSKADVAKLLSIRNDQTAEVKKLLRKIIQRDDVSKISIGLGGKEPDNIPHYSVDYVMTFDYSDLPKGNIEWKIWILDTTLLEDIKPLINHDGKLEGTLKIGIINKIA